MLASQSDSFFATLALNKLTEWYIIANFWAIVFPYYASIMLNALGYLLCFKLCWHNRPGPISHDQYNYGLIFNADGDIAALLLAS